ncbi:universal stress protein [Halomarina pelagica]|uniref:universal stress protein n=1 Tax=Halomarina pelagica TaxID=2961599 RepID=UPI0020C23C57|nr:universal stress protein [Halomarina sp. BND7]
MDRILVVAEPSESGVALVEEAGRVAAETDAGVVVLAPVVEGEEDEWLDAIRETTDLADEREPSSPVGDLARRFADSLGSDVLAPLGVEYLAIGDHVETNRPSAEIMGVAENHACDYIYLLTHRRSPTGKAIFGDTVQSVILNFDGYVTVTTR